MIDLKTFLPPRFYVGVTDTKWFEFLRAEPALDEVNFWSPGSRRLAAGRGTPFVFKLRAPMNAIGGIAFVSFVESMAIRDAWEFFGRENGVSSLQQLRERIAANRPSKKAELDDEIGCFVLSQPTFFPLPIPQPEDWPPSLQGGKYYSTGTAAGLRVWRDIVVALSDRLSPPVASPFGGVELRLQPARIGQGAFRKLVLDAYGRQCAVSGEHTVPVLQASHIRPFADVAQHEVTNGLALRSDIHTLFDRGYLTVTPDYELKVSKRLREDFDNGEIYYEYERSRPKILVPDAVQKRPNRELLEWHNETMFHG
jgi:putative restriction endonuclease